MITLMISGGYDPLRGFLQKLTAFLPRLLVSALILLAGIVLGLLVKAFCTKVFIALKLDSFFDRTGLNQMLSKGGVRESASRLLARIIGWIVLLIFAVTALVCLNVPAVEGLLEQVFLYLPKVFAACLILLIGYLVANFLGRAALIACVNAGIPASKPISKGVRILILLLAATMALEQLEIARRTITIAFAILFGGGVLALAIAFGLGGKDIARKYLEKRFKKEDEKDEFKHI